MAYTIPEMYKAITTDNHIYSKARMYGNHPVPGRNGQKTLEGRW